jgi:hypothetical protein
MPFPVVCPSCDKRLNAPDNARGKRAKCGKCGTSFTVAEAPIESGPAIGSVKDVGISLDAGEVTPRTKVDDLLGQLPRVSGIDDLLGALVSKPPDTHELEEMFGSTPALPKTKACPMCGETILETAKKCKHCAEIIDPYLVAQAKAAAKGVDRKRQKARRLPMVLGAGGVVLLIAFLFLAWQRVMGPAAGDKTASNTKRPERQIAVLQPVVGSPTAEQAQPVAHPVEPPKPGIRKELFEPLFRVATELKGGQDVGINRSQFGTLLQKFATEVTIAKEKSETPLEREAADAYGVVLQTYKDAAKVWDVKISLPQLKQQADEWYRQYAPVRDSGQYRGFLIAIAYGIPLTVYPEGTTGLDEIVRQYELTTTNRDGNFQTIPEDSIQVLWERARLKNDEVDKLRKSGSN